MPPAPHHWSIRILMVIALALALAASPTTVSTAAVHAAIDLSARGWFWPLERFRLSEPYVAPAHAYGPGHRGIDLTPAATAAGTAAVRAPADGVIAFAGSVAGRGVVTIDHGGGLVTTLEPVTTALTAGTAIARGSVVGELALGGHTAAGDLHFGVRLDGRYINPLLLLGGVPRAVLLPCCAAATASG